MILRGVRQLGPSYAFNFEPPNIDSREIGALPTHDPTLKALSELGKGERLGRSSTDRARGVRHHGVVGAPVATRSAATASVAADPRQDLQLAALSGALTPLIMLAYNPGVWGGEYFLDNTPELNPVKWTNGSHVAPQWRKQAESGATARSQAMFFMAGSNPHCLIQPRARDGGSSGGGDRGGRRAHASDGIRAPSSHISHAPSRARGWSGLSGVSGVSGDDGNTSVGDGGNGRERRHAVRPRPQPGSMHAARLPGTRECVTRDVRDALDSLGGIKVLLPLFAQYDHGVRRAGRGDGTGDEDSVSFQTDPRLNETVLALFAGTLRDRCARRCRDCGCLTIDVRPPPGELSFSSLLHWDWYSK